MTTIRPVLVLSLGSLAACESNAISNEPLPPLEDAAAVAAGHDAATQLPAADSGTAVPPGHGPGDSAILDPARTGDASRAGSPIEAGATDAETSGPMAGGDGAGPPASGPPKVPGSAKANNCSSYGPRMGEACYGLWCGVTEASISAERPPGGPCKGLTSKLLCDGKVQMQLMMCAIRERSDLVNLLDSEEVLRMKVQGCFYEDPTLAVVEPACLVCFLESGECAGRNCLTQCLASEGRSAVCDQCRFDNNCFQPLPACAGLPSPF